MVENDKTKMNVRRKSGSQVKRAREVTSIRKTDYKNEMTGGRDEF